MTYEDLIQIYLETSASIQDTLRSLRFLNPNKWLLTQMVPALQSAEHAIKEGENQIRSCSDSKEEYQLSNIFLAWHTLNNTINHSRNLFNDSEFLKHEGTLEQLYEYFLEIDATILIKKLTAIAVYPEATAHLNHILAPAMPEANNAMIKLLKQVLTIRVLALVNKIVDLKEKETEVSRLLGTPSDIKPVTYKQSNQLQKQPVAMFSIEDTITKILTKAAPKPAANPSPSAS